MQSKSRARRVLFWAAAVSLPLALAAIVSCRNDAPPPGGDPAPRPYAGAAVRVACPDDRTAAVLRTHGEPWARSADVRLEIVAVGGDPAADVWLLPPAELPRHAAAGALHLVPQELLRDPTYAWDRLLPLYGQKLLVWDGMPYGLPVLGEAPLCFYRTDLLGDAKHRSAFAEKHGRELSPPATWEEFEEVAGFFHGRTGTGLPPLPAGDDGLDRLFHQVAACYARRAVPEEEDLHGADNERQAFSFHYDLGPGRPDDPAAGRPRIDGPGFVHALELLRRLQAFRPAEASADPADAFRRGGAVLCLADATWIARFHDRQSAVRGKFAVCRVPGSRSYFDFHSGERRQARGVQHVPYLGADGRLGVVPRTARHPEAAFALLAALSGPRLSRQIVFDPRWGGGATRDDHLADSRGWTGFDPVPAADLVGILRQTLRHYGLKNPLLRLRTPDEDAHQEALLAAVRASLQGKEPPGQALAAAADRWRQLDRQGDAARRLADYYRSLSLRPPFRP